MFFRGYCQKDKNEYTHLFMADDFEAAHRKYNDFIEQTLPNYDVIKVVGIGNFDGAGFREDDFILED